VHGFIPKKNLVADSEKSNDKDLRKATVNKDIAGRPYQLEAIQRVAETLVTDEKKGICGNKRRLVSHGYRKRKTRTAAALVDVLFKNNWVKSLILPIETHW
jgi:type I restriction enzyme R subunit